MAQNNLDLQTYQESKTLFCNNEVLISEIVGTKLQETTFRQGMALLQTDKNIQFSGSKMKLFWNELSNTMTDETYKSAVKLILSKNTYNDVQIKDFQEAKKDLPKFYNRIWYLKTISEFPETADSIDIYENENKIGFYKFSDGTLKKYPNLKPIFVNGKYVKVNNG